MSKANEPSSEREIWPVQIVVNGSSVAGDVEPRTLLIDFLRNNAQLTGSRIGCEEGACGACTVELDGQTIKSCLTLAVQADGGSITTIEGVAENNNLAKVQQAFIDCHAVQCGYCTSGMIMSARAFLESVGSADFSDEDVRHALSGNYCRCTGYNNIIQAVKVAAGKEAPPVHCDTDAPPDGNWIGQPVVRREDSRLVRGGGRYTDNYGTASDLHLFIVRSQRAHANITSINTTAAKNAPGVALVLTGQEALEHWQPIAPTMDQIELNLPRRYAIAIEKVVYYGEPIAIVVATNPYLAEDAARLVEVEYEDLPANTDLVRTANVGADDSALLYPEWGNNIQIEYRFELGPVDAAFEAADLVVDEEIVLPRIGAMPMETRMVHADFNRADQRLVVRASTQFRTR